MVPERDHSDWIFLRGTSLPALSDSGDQAYTEIKEHMPIELTPENQRLIDDAIRSGAYSTPEQVIGRALEVLSLEDEWLPERRLAIDEKIASGLAQLDRGEGIPGDQAHAALQSRKVNFLAQQSTTR